MHRIGLDVLGIEVLRRRSAAQSPRGSHEPGRPRRRRELDDSELAHGRPTQLASQAAQRHEVDLRQDRSADRVHVVAVGRVETELAHHRGIELGVHRVGTPGAVLVVLDPDQSGLGRAVEAGHDQQLGVGLLEVVGGAVHDVLAELLQRAPAGQVVRDPLGADRLGEESSDLGLEVVATGHLLAQRLEEECLELQAHAEELEVPLHRVRHALEAAVVQLVADIQRELEVVAEGVHDAR